MKLKVQDKEAILHKYVQREHHANSVLMYFFSSNILNKMFKNVYMFLRFALLFDRCKLSLSVERQFNVQKRDQ